VDATLVARHRQHRETDLRPLPVLATRRAYLFANFGFDAAKWSAWEAEKKSDQN
jgi:N-acetylglutamate synthase-like GNAT family acetyltransferase